MRPDVLTHVLALARRQHGVITSAQCHEAGMTRQQVRTRVARGEWRRTANGTLVVGGAASTWLQEAMVVTLGHRGGLALSHRAAACLHGFDGFRNPPPIEVVSLSSHVVAVGSDVVFHRSGVLSTHDVTKVRRIRTTNIAATLCLLPQVVGPARVAQSLDCVLRAGSSPRWILETGQRLRRRGLHGPNVVLELLADRVSRRLPRSWFERLAAAVLRRAGVALVHEHPVRDDSGRILASLDLAEPALKVDVECQSWAEHGSPGQQYRDIRRRRMLRTMGWEVVDVWWWDLTCPDDVTNDVLIALDHQRRLRRSAS